MLLTPLYTCRCVILGQDPYPTPGVANGLAFSVNEDVVKLPPSLCNIFQEYSQDTGYPLPLKGDLSSWARQGVLLLNRILTLPPGDSLGHVNLGWQELTNEILKTVAEDQRTTVFILWGSEAQKSISMIGTNPRVLSAHPSPLSAHQGFFGSRPFTKVNALLQSGHRNTVNWRLP